MSALHTNIPTKSEARADVQETTLGMFSQSAVGIVKGSADGEILMVNQKLCQILGYPEEELLGRSSRPLSHPDDDAITQVFLARMHSGEIDNFTIEKRYIRKDGSPVWVNSAISAIRNEDGTVKNIFAVVQDISDRKEAEEAYRLSTERLQRLFRLSEAVTRAESIPHIYELALAGLRETLGADRAAVLLSDSDDVMRFKAWIGLSDEYRALAEGHSPWARDAVDPEPVLTRDVSLDHSLGDLRNQIIGHGIHALGFIPLLHDGDLLGKLMIYYDQPHAFTDEEVQVAQTIANHVAMAIARKTAEGRLKLYEQIVHNSIDGIAIIDMDGCYIEQNRAHEELLGYPSDELQGRTPAIHLGPEKFQEVADALAQTGVYRGEAESTTRHGKALDIELSAFTVVDDEGHPVCLVGIKRDVTERNRAEMLIRESEERFRTMANSAPVLLWISDQNAKGTWFNRPWLEFTGRTMDQEIGDGWTDSVHPEDREYAWNTCKSAFAEQAPFEMEFRMRRSDGEYRWILDHAVPRFNPDGEFVGYIGSCKDITDRKKALQTIEQANFDLEKRVEERTAELLMANRELEGFTYSVSHDLRAPLRAIMATSRILLDECSPSLGESHIEMLQRQAENARKLGMLIDDLLKLSRLSRQEIVREHVNLSEMAREVADDLQTRTTHCQVEFLIHPSLVAQADQKLIRFVLLNLLENACKFSPEGGTIEVGQQGEAFFVRDQGIGFDMEYSSKLFLPFERLVRDDEFPGTGIGLANAKRIVERHHGRIWADSQPGQGATFYFTIPV